MRELVKNYRFSIVIDKFTVVNGGYANSLQ